MKGIICTWAGIMLLGGLGTPAWASGTRAPELIMLVVPQRYTVIQVSQDLVSRHNAVVVAYQGQSDTAEPPLQAWDGQRWHRIAFNDYREARFLRQQPREVLLFGDAGELPASLVEASSWAPKVWKVDSVQTSDMVNAFGKVLRFDRNEWQWWTDRYKLDLSDVNSNRRSDSWYYHPYVAPPPSPDAPHKPVVSAQGIVVPTAPEPAPVVIETPPKTPQAPPPPLPATPEGFSEEAIAE